MPLVAVASGDRTNFNTDHVTASVNGKFNIGDRGVMRVGVGSDVVANLAGQIAGFFQDRPNVQVTNEGSDIVVSFVTADAGGTGNIGPLAAIAIPFIIAAVVTIVKLLVLAWVMYKVVELAGQVIGSLKDNPILIVGLVGGMLVLALVLAESGQQRPPPVIVIRDRYGY